MTQPDEPEDLTELLRHDSLAEQRKARLQTEHWQLLTSAKLIAPRLGELNAGFHWCSRQVYVQFSDDTTTAAANRFLMPPPPTSGRSRSSTASQSERMRNSHSGSSQTSSTASSLVSGLDTRSLLEGGCGRRAAELLGELELARADQLLRARHYGQAIRVLAQFERLGSVEELSGAGTERALRAVRCAAFTNLAFVHLLRNELQQADRYTQLVRRLDQTHVGALVNAACVRLASDRPAEAKSLLQDALLQDANCVPALFDLVLCSRRLGRMEEALRLLFRLQTVLGPQDIVLFQIATV